MFNEFGQKKLQGLIALAASLTNYLYIMLDCQQKGTFAHQ